MYLHANAKLGLAGRLSLVRLVESGVSIREAPRRHGVSPATGCTWWHRWRDASSAERQALACLQDRSSRPRSSPRMLSRGEQERICEARRNTGWGPRQLAGRLGHPHQTVWKTLRRHGCSRRQPTVREPANRYEWPCPGDLLHMDSASYARFDRPGHKLTGDRSKTGAEKRAAPGYDYAHAIVDDHTRLAYVELLDDERAATVVAFTKRALRFFEEHGIQLRRLMTDKRLGLHPQPRPTQPAQRAWDQADPHETLPATHERQGRTLPPNHGPRMGLRRPLPRQHRPPTCSATLAQPLRMKVKCWTAWVSFARVSLGCG